MGPFSLLRAVKRMNEKSRASDKRVTPKTLKRKRKKLGSRVEDD